MTGCISISTARTRCFRWTKRGNSQQSSKESPMRSIPFRAGSAANNARWAARRPARRRLWLRWRAPLRPVSDGASRALEPALSLPGWAWPTFAEPRDWFSCDGFGAGWWNSLAPVRIRRYRGCSGCTNSRRIILHHQYVRIDFRQGQAHLQGGRGAAVCCASSSLADGNFFALGISNNLLIIWRPVEGSG
jgi:hypothetical protein